MKALAASAAVVMALFAATVSWFAISSDSLDGEPHAVLALDASSRPRAAPEAPRQSSGDRPAMAPAGTAGKDPAAGPGAQRSETETQRLGSAALQPPPGVSIIGLDATGPKPLEVPETGAEAKPKSGEAAMVSAPIVGLVEDTRYGPLPRISEDGRRPSKIYARPSRHVALPRSGEPARIAILINGMGLSEVTTSEAINKLPAPVTLAFGPYGRNLQGWVRQARSAGHEVMLQIPLEPFDYPDNDPGPHTLLTNLPPDENRKRLHWLMARFTGYTGLTNHMGAKFAAAKDAFLPVLEELKARGLIYLDDGTSARSTAGQIATDLGLGYSVAQVAIDTQESPQDIERALAKLETLAKENGLVIGVGTSLPLTIQQIAKWSKTLNDKDIVLIPISAAVRAKHQS